MRTKPRKPAFAALFALLLAASIVAPAAGHAEGGAGGFRCYVCD